MNGFVIINDCLQEMEAGDVSVYDSATNALRAMEVHDIGDDNIHIYDDARQRLKLVLVYRDGKEDINFEETGTVFEGLADVLLQSAKVIGIVFEEDNPSFEALVSALYRYSPNPYA